MVHRYGNRASRTQRCASPSKMTLYVLKCADDCWYVGITSDMDRRWKEHSTGRGAEWTKLHSPLFIDSQREVPSDNAEEEEKKMTSKMIWTHGVNKVRGGTLTCGREYDFRASDVNNVLGCLSKSLRGGARAEKYSLSKVISKKVKPSTVRAESTSRSGTCFRCGRGTHWRKDCYAKTHAEGWKIWESGCEKCGRCGHTVSGCYARKDKNGDQIQK